MTTELICMLLPTRESGPPKVLVIRSPVFPCISPSGWAHHTGMEHREILWVIRPVQGGMRTHVDSVLRHLDPRRWRLTAASSQSAGEVLRGDIPRALDRWVRLPSEWTGSPVAMMRAASRLRRISRGVHLCHAHGLRAGVLTRVSGMGVPVVISLHNLLKGALSLATARLLADHPATRVHAVSQAVARSLEPGSVDVIGNGWRSVPRVRRRTGDRCRLLCVSRLAPEKGVHLLLQALHQVGGGDWTLQVVGDGPLRGQLERLSESLGLSPRTGFAGWIEDVTAHYSSADILVVPSLREGAGLVVAEGMSAGLAVVATTAGGIPEMITHRRTGWLVEPGDPEGLASALRTLMSDPQLRLKLGEAARKEAESRPRWEDTVERIESIYEDLISV